MGVDAQQHRIRIGQFSNLSMTIRKPVVKNRVCIKSVLSMLSSPWCMFVCFMIVYFYIISFTLIMVLCISLNSNPDHDLLRWAKLNIMQCNIPFNTNLFFLSMLGCSIAPAYNGVSHHSNGIRTFAWRRLSYSLFLKQRGFISTMLLYLTSINIVLLVICNTSLLNPGPRQLKVFYNNCQGLINTRDLTSENPPLNMTKLHELHGFLFRNKPDILILNETLMKKSILDNEILPNNYKIFRLDRTIASHPWDPNQPKKFRKNGGGILIAHRNDLDIGSTKISFAKVQAELLSVVFKLPQGKKFCVSTFYRVGNLGVENFHEFTKYFKLLATKNKIDQYLLVGDMNLYQVKWPEGETNCSLQSNFIEFLVRDLGHTQMINEATHRAGNTLDLLFTNIPDKIKNITILDRDEACLSDHFGILLSIEFPVVRKKGPKKKVYNYNKANWMDLNYDLKHIDWDSYVGANDPHISWPIFKAILLNLCDKYIPRRNVKSEFQPPWYNSECEKILRDKERWRKRARETGKVSDMNKFRQLRRNFKRTMNEKMRLNVNDSSDPALISKKFWKYVKTKSKSTRIPETIRSGELYRNKAVDQANLFNEYFYSQFSDANTYDVDIGFR